MPRNKDNVELYNELRDELEGNNGCYIDPHESLEDTLKRLKEQNETQIEIISNLIVLLRQKAIITESDIDNKLINNIGWY